MHRYLEASPQCDPGFRKEYHVWDALDLPVGQARPRADREAGRAAGGVPPRPDQLLRLLLRAARAARDPAHRRHHARRTPRCRPSGWRSIRAGFESRGVRPAAVYLMRDPVERIWSAARMDMRRRGDEAPEDPRDPGQPHVRARPMYADRTRYDLHHGRARRGVPARRTSSTASTSGSSTCETLRALCDVPRHRLPRARPRPAGQRVARRPRAPPCPRTPVRTMARHFAPVYDAVAAPVPRRRPGRALAVHAVALTGADASAAAPAAAPSR